MHHSDAIDSLKRFAQTAMSHKFPENSFSCWMPAAKLAVARRLQILPV